MKKYLKLLTIIVVAFVMMIGINVNAEVSQWSSYIDVVVPIHKTDESGKGLEGAVFTLKDFNNTISYSSSDERDGDYLIETYKESPEMLDKIINSLPSNYKDVITGLKSWDDVQNLQNRNDINLHYYDSYANVNIIIPLKVEETVAPDGYEKQDYVVTGIVNFYFEKNSIPADQREDIEARSDYFDEFYDNGFYVGAELTVIETEYDQLPGYFEYDSSKDYVTIFERINKNLVANQKNSYSSPEEFMKSVIKIYEDEGYNTEDIKCPEIEDEPVEMLARNNFEDIQMRSSLSRGMSYCSGGETFREDIEARFDDYIEDCYCVIQIKDKKKTITVNPATSSTISIIALLSIIGFAVVMTNKKVKNS